MAGTRTNFHVFWVLLIVAVFGIKNSSTSAQLPVQSLVSDWATAISNSLIIRLNTATGISQVKERYLDENLPPLKVNGSDLVLQVAAKWQRMLGHKMTAVTKIVDALEDAFANYTQNGSISVESVKYLNAKDMQNVSLTYEENFKSNVTTSNSSVQIPTDIYVEDKTILNGILATNPVDEVFRKNYEEDPQLLWQYFGSADGFYRSYPAAKWITDDPDKDQYDVRRRGWYIQAASSPKNVLILIDVSGSTFGMTLEITKVSVYKALDTLGNDDFVNVASFNSTSKLISCFDTFVQANLRNRNLLKERVKLLKASGVANFRDGLVMAFNEFEKFEKIEKKGREEQNQGADCHRVILIFTDGGEANEEETFTQYNNPISVRVFVFKVGTDSMVPADGVKDMACSNKGFFSNIQSFGAVRLTTLDYVPVLSRPMVLSKQKHFQWSDIYLDVLGLGMMTTLTQPVYNKTGENSMTNANNTYQNQQMLAVVGTDITTKNMEDTVPQRKPGYESLYKNSIGPEGYAFGINSNGYILLHPRLKAELGYLTEPPNVDFLEVEYNYPAEKEQLRIDMIDQKTGVATMVTPVMSQDERYLEFPEVTYSYTFIENTTFSVAIAQPKFGIFELDINATNIDLAVDLGSIIETQEDVTLLIAPWVFCKSHVGRQGDITTAAIVTAIQEAIAKIHGVSETLVECDDYMTRKLLFDGNITKQVAEHWKSTNASSPDAFNGVNFNVVATQGGITRIFPSSVPNSWTPDETAAFQDPWDQPYYRRALYTDNYVFAAPYNPDETAELPINQSFLTPLMASKAVHLNSDIIHAVVAVQLDPNFFNELWITNTKQGFNNKESGALSCSNETIHCYILDDGGFIVATNQDMHQTRVGGFFGVIDGDVMTDLKNKTVYKRMQMNDFQAACPRQDDAPASAIRLRSLMPSTTDIFNFNYWAVTATWTLLRHFLYDMIFLGATNYQPNFAEDIPPPDNVSCIKVLKQFFYGGVNLSSGLTNSTECPRQWHASRINGTNLLLLVTEGICDNYLNTPVTQIAMDPLPGEGPDPCLAKPRYRKRPTEHCYDFNVNESVTECTSTAGLPTYLPPIIAVHLLIATMTRLLVL